MRQVSRTLAAITALFATCGCLLAQTDKREIRKGNRAFGRQKWQEAEIDYRRALAKDSSSFAAAYNLASSLYRQENFSAARETLSSAGVSEGAGGNAAGYYFNLGDAALKEKDYKAAVDAFKSALIADPSDLDAKENYIYAKKMLQEEENGGGGGNDVEGSDGGNGDDGEDPDDSGDRGDDGQDRQQDEGKDSGSDDKGGQDKDSQGQNGGENVREGLSPEQERRMLKAIQAKEKETADKVAKEKAALLKSRQKEKNW